MYTDGCILYLSVSEPTAHAVTEALAEHVEDHAASDDGLSWAWILRGITESEAHDLLESWIDNLSIKLADNRHMDHYRIELYVNLVKRVSPPDDHDDHDGQDP